MHIIRCLLVACLLGTAGCARGPTMAKVNGTVTYNGKALPQGNLIFESPGQRPASARIENGQIVEATTYKPDDGVPVGSHKIAVSATEAAAASIVSDPGKASLPDANYMGGKSLIPGRYNDPEKSGLTAEIKAGENRLELKLTD